jgi:TRAP-type mannitol/chloroaromatic compound transport system substrate-binding protein
MIGEIIDAVTTLFEYSDRFKEAEQQKKTDIANYFQSIKESLLEIVKELQNNNTDNQVYNWTKINACAENLPQIMGEVIGQDKAENISNQLTRAIGNNPSDNINISQLQSLAGMFSALADNVTVNGRKNTDKKSIFPKNRRAFLYTAIGTSVGLTAGWLASQHKPPIKWKMATFLGEDAKELIIYKAQKMVRDRIEAMTDGNFIIELDTSRKVKTEEILDDVNEGKIQCGYSGIYYAQKEFRSLFFGSAIPFGLNPQEQSAWLYYKKQTDDEFTFIQTIYEKTGLNVIPFPTGATGAQMGGWFNKKINSIEDFDGLTMRITGLGADVLERFGVSSDTDKFGTPIPITDIANKLAREEIEAAEWVGPHDDLQLGLEAKYYYYPGWWEPSTTFDVQVNKDAWNELPEEYKEIFKNACSATYLEILTQYYLENSKALQTIRQLEKSGELKVLRFSDEILLAAKAQTESLLDYYASGSDVFTEVYEEWKTFKEQIRDWSNLN